ncbi:hypothetical protein C8R44DRAFT_726008 [Mycena epipterygia]|nr:hypothetical protein C8R44DRAFT_726008 [Mycena epipterygia]
MSDPSTTLRRPRSDSDSDLERPNRRQRVGNLVGPVLTRDAVFYKEGGDCYLRAEAHLFKVYLLLYPRGDTADPPRQFCAQIQHYSLFLAPLKAIVHVLNIKPALDCKIYISLLELSDLREIVTMERTNIQAPNQILGRPELGRAVVPESGKIQNKVERNSRQGITPAPEAATRRAPRGSGHRRGRSTRTFAGGVGEACASEIPIRTKEMTLPSISALGFQGVMNGDDESRIYITATCWIVPFSFPDAIARSEIKKDMRCRGSFPSGVKYRVQTLAGTWITMRNVEIEQEEQFELKAEREAKQ